MTLFNAKAQRRLQRTATLCLKFANGRHLKPTHFLTLAVLSLLLAGCMTPAQKRAYATGLSLGALCNYAVNDANRENSEIAVAELEARGVHDWATICPPLAAQVSATNAANSQALLNYSAEMLKRSGRGTAASQAPSQTQCYARPGGGFYCTTF